MELVSVLSATAAIGLGIALGGVAACGSGEVILVDGTESTPCPMNGSCKAGLACVRGTCVAAADCGAVAAPSCAPGGAGMTDCGDGAESCCTSPEVVGGTFFRTYANSGSGPEGEADPATVSNFRLDEYEVTVGRFRQFLNASRGTSSVAGWLPPQGSGKHTHLSHGAGLLSPNSGLSHEIGWDAENNSYLATYQDAWEMADNVDTVDRNLTCNGSAYATWTAAAGSHEKLPMNCVSWYDAYAFCIWDGGFLPSEAEWEYAAAGGSQEREYPWGTTAPGTASQYAIYGCEYPSSSGSCSNASNLAPVGTATAGAGAWGQQDLAGNVYEWNLDYWNQWYVESQLCAEGAKCAVPCVDCLDQTKATGTPYYLPRVARGSEFRKSPSFMVPPKRSYAPETDREEGVGFRCARTP